MNVNEIFLSIQGEGLNTGFPTVFVRFSECNLRCSYCDTQYAYKDGKEMHIHEIIAAIDALGYQRVCLTGGEPLLQKDIQLLLDLLSNYRVSIETNGSIAVSPYKMGDKHTFTMDLKTPGSGEHKKMHLENLNALRDNDEIKFVIGTKEDYEWAKDIIKRLYVKGIVTFSPVFDVIESKDIIAWILRDKLEVRFQLQLHKWIWHPNERGV